MLMFRVLLSNILHENLNFWMFPIYLYFKGYNAYRASCGTHGGRAKQMKDFKDGMREELVTRQDTITYQLLCLSLDPWYET